jgi:enhancing lycopene biosynthesis protein 2
MLRLHAKAISRLLGRSFSSQAPKNVAVVLSGCGVYDGSEITESVATLVHLSSRGCSVKAFAPYQPQMHVVDHTSGEEMKEKRNVLTESARITRGPVEPLDMLDEKDFDAVIFPGGFGAAKNLSTFATVGLDCGIHPKVKGILEKFHGAQKPIGLCCIAPVLAAKALGKQVPNLELTVGCDAAQDSKGNTWPHYEAAGAIEAFGATHVVTGLDSAHVDTVNRVVTSGAYMCDAAPHEVFANVGLMVEEVVKLTDDT